MRSLSVYSLVSASPWIGHISGCCNAANDYQRQVMCASVKGKPFHFLVLTQHCRVYFYNERTRESVWEKPSAQPSTVRASHILCKHAGSRRPSSWRQANITMSKTEAIAKLQGIRDSIVSGGKRFEDIAQVESDCSRCADRYLGSCTARALAHSSSAVPMTQCSRIKPRRHFTVSVQR